MQLTVYENFVEKLSNVLKENSYILFAIIAAIVVIVVVVIIIVVSTQKKKKNEKVAKADELLIKETLKEQASETSSASKEKPIQTETKKEEPTSVKEVKAGKPDLVKEEAEEVRAEQVSPAKEEVVEEKAMNDEVVEKQEAPKTAKAAKPKAATSTTKSAVKAKNDEVKDEDKDSVPAKKTRVVNGKYEVYFDGNKYFYILKASNGEKLITSELYASKDSVYKAIEAIKRNVCDGEISISQDKRGLFQFYLTAKNHRTLVVSANYPTEKRAIAASESFKRFAPNSPVFDIEEQVESIKEEITISTTDKKGGKLGVLNDGNGNYYYVLKASNGEVLVHSNMYNSLEKAENGLKNFKEAVKNGKFFVEKDKRDFYQFKLYSATNRIVEVGETYSTKSQAISSANSVCSFIELATPFEE